MSRHSSVDELERLVLSFNSLIAIETIEEDRVRSMLMEVATRLRLPFYEWSVTTGLARRMGTVLEGTTDPLTMLNRIEEISDDDAIYFLKDFAPHLNHPNVVRTLRELAAKLSNSHSAIAVSGDPLELPRDLDAIAVHFRIDLPDAQEIRETIRQVIDTMAARKRFLIDLSRDDAQRLVRSLSGLTLSQVRRVVSQAILADGKLSGDDIERVIRWKGEIIEKGGILQFYPLEGNHFQIGGFARLKSWLDHAKVGFTPQARALNLTAPKGILLVGVQGCGKSLAAKFIAREWKLPLLKLDAGRLYDKYVGESEKNFRRATQLAEAMAPVVVWIDEIEKAFAYSHTEQDSGLSQRLFGAMLTWLQEKKQEVFVVGAANDLSRLPPEFLRKGRFDEIFFVDLPNLEERLEILRIHLALRKQDPADFDLTKLAGAAEGFSGAELEQVVIAALYRTLHQKVRLTTDSVLEAIRSTVPLSRSRQEDIQRLRDLARERFTPVA
jgi:hypothetical protein